MDYQIRRSFFETSSSSASAFIMVSDKGKRQRVKLSRPWVCIRGGYNTGGDGIPHEYLCRWQDKMAFMVRDETLWHRMFKKATGQDFILYDLYTRGSREIWDDKHNWKRLYNIPDGIVVDVTPAENGRVISEYGSIIGYCYPFEDPVAVALPTDIPLAKIFDEYHLNNCFTTIDSITSLKDIIEQVGEENFDEDILAEIIFNPGFAINIGGDAHFRDSGVGVVNGYLGDEEKNSPLRYAGYSLLNGSYKNGGEVLLIGFDGTKLRVHKNDTPPEYPESIDLKLTDQCLNECAFCYENSTPDGIHGEIPEKLFEQIPPFTEVAVGGGNPLLHPEFFYLHDKFKAHFNATLHANDFLSYVYDKAYLKELLRFDAIGVSVCDKEQAENIAEYLIELCKKTDDYYAAGDKIDNRYLEPWDRNGLYFGIYCTINGPYSEYVKSDEHSDLVIHVINYVVNEDILKPLYDKGLKLLILGYKTKGRGIDFIKDPALAENYKWLYDNIEEVARHFDAVAFDTLALEQLEIRRLVSEEDWRHLYMGDDGLHSMYIDLVRGEYGISSTDERRWKLTDDLKQMFAHVRSVVLQNE